MSIRRDTSLDKIVDDAKERLQTDANIDPDNKENTDSFKKSTHYTELYETNEDPYNPKRANKFERSSNLPPRNGRKIARSVTKEKKSLSKNKKFILGKKGSRILFKQNSFN